MIFDIVNPDYLAEIIKQCDFITIKNLCVINRKTYLMCQNRLQIGDIITQKRKSYKFDKCVKRFISEMKRDPSYHNFINDVHSRFPTKEHKERQQHLQKLQQQFQRMSTEKHIERIKISLEQTQTRLEKSVKLQQKMRAEKRQYILKKCKIVFCTYAFQINDFDLISEIYNNDYGSSFIFCNELYRALSTNNSSNITQLVKILKQNVHMLSKVFMRAINTNGSVEIKFLVQNFNIDAGIINRGLEIAQRNQNKTIVTLLTSK